MENPSMQISNTTPVLCMDVLAEAFWNRNIKAIFLPTSFLTTTHMVHLRETTTQQVYR
jgi:hypothetical protein